MHNGSSLQASKDSRKSIVATELKNSFSSEGQLPVTNLILENTDKIDGTGPGFRIAIQS
uniref:Uncharacterized protein n=1 Tax=Medicago truncatula TaxID=3880 RepID=I3S7K8_MEDTR|nr:unknown [Medicago truncatula]